ncbi:MAG: diaminopimelate epimerase [Flavobacteriales bacterium]|jgi:diaminopimelate epimerase|nr:diaminopimelate epimerase [Flavobacteriales bacterium]
MRFSKWHGTGNDFVLVDDRDGRYGAVAEEAARRLCDRHFGIGSDGLIMVRAPREPGTAYHMDFYNPDGSQSFCGNGSRCAFAFWAQCSGHAPSEQARVAFTAVDGRHHAAWLSQGWVAIGMRPPTIHEQLSPELDHWHTGSPHLVSWVAHPEGVDLVREGRALRYDQRFAPGGVNVNFVAVKEGVVHLRTYERGVEDETLSCGTGVTAAAWSAWTRGVVKGEVVPVRTRGGDLRVDLSDARKTREALLCGPVQEVFTGEVPWA